MRSIAILGSGDLAATLARRLAETERARHVVMVDADDSRARGKALDIAQSAPVERFDCRVEGARDLRAAGPWDALVVADAADLGDLGGAAPAPRLVPAILGAGREALVVVGIPHACPLVEALVAAGMRRERVLGSVAIAQSAALRRHLAVELDVEPRAVSATVIGRPPHGLLVPRGSATAGGLPVEGLSPVALRRALHDVVRRVPGPVALAAAACRLLAALDGSRAALLPVVAVLQGEYGHRGTAAAVPARLAAGQLHDVVEVPLEPVDRVALDNALRRR